MIGNLLGGGDKAGLQAAFMVMLAAAFTLLWADMASAQAINLTPVQTLLQSILTALTGPLGKVLATLALIGVAISFFFGIIELKMALWVVVAIVVIGSATVIVDSMWATKTTP